MKYQLKQGIDREEMRDQYIGPIRTKTQVFKIIDTIGEAGEAVSISPLAHMDLGGPYVIEFIRQEWTGFYATEYEVPTISAKDFITKYFEPCTTK